MLRKRAYSSGEAEKIAKFCVLYRMLEDNFLEPGSNRSLIEKVREYTASLAERKKRYEETVPKNIREAIERREELVRQAKESAEEIIAVPSVREMRLHCDS